MAQIPTTQMVQDAFAGDTAKLPELTKIDGEVVQLKAVRRPVALVTTIMKRTNNFYVTGDRGLKAVGIADPLVLSPYLEPEEGQQWPADEVVGEHNHVIDGTAHKDCPRCAGLKENPEYDPTAALALVPGIVEVIIMLTCTKQELYAFEDDFVWPSVPGKPGYLLRQRVLAFMEEHSPVEVMQCFPHIDAEFKHIQNSTTKVADNSTKGSEQPGEA